MRAHKFYIFTIYFAIILKCAIAAEEGVNVWQWSCEDGRCIRKLREDNLLEPGLSLEACKMFCDDFGLLWPRPTGITQLGSFLSKINIDAIDILPPKRGQSDPLVEAAVKRFKESISESIPEDVSPKATGKAVNIYLVNKKPHVREFTLNVDDEGYRITVESSINNKINATIIGNTFFGLRHGLETLSQLILYDDVRDHLLIVRDVVIEDRPVYTYRGILLDTARNYYSMDSIRRTIDAMAAVKLNTFHWHITDSQSFPFVSDRRPELARRGAYSPRKIYTKEMIKDLVEYGRERGVRVLPEFDAPAHVGEGWQKTNLTVCFKAEPWSHFCVEPPCGQLNPIRDELYNYLEDIYFDMADSFTPDMFHMGGDEVSERCWNSSEEIQNYMVQNRWGLDKSSYLQLWNYFQQKAQDRVYKAFGKRLPLILWTSTLTDYSHVEKFLNKDEYIIQVWTTGGDPQIKGLLQKGYKLIMSNYDALYMDCGFGAWVGTGNNWCSPYIGWQKVYDNSPAQIAQQFKDQILGGEAALWSEQADEFTLDGRLWPRAAALAERLWAEPDTTWQEAEHRMLQVRERLVRLGVSAESIQPEWCYQNEGFCYSNQ